MKKRVLCVLCALLMGIMACGSAAAEEWSASFITAMVTDTATLLSPLTATNRDVLSMDMLVYESLIELDDSGKPTTCLASSWTAEDAGWTWYFTIREGIAFHNGAALTAADAAATLNYILANKCGAWSQALNAMVDSCEAVDERTLKVSARAPSYALLYAMTFPVVPSGEVSASQPSGTGPYRVVDAEPGSRVRLRRNENWWKRTPTLETIEIRNFANFDSALGQLDIKAVDAVATRSLSAARFRGVNSYHVTDYVTRQLECLVPNMSADSPMSALNVRQAVMEALDKQALISNVYLSMATQADACVPPGDWLYEPLAEVYDYDPNGARIYLAAAGWTDVDADGIMEKQTESGAYEQLDIRIITYEEPDYPSRQDAATLIAEQLGDVGFNVTIEVMSQSELLKAMRSGDYDLALVGYYLSMAPDYKFMLGSGGDSNLNGYSSELMDAALDEALTSVAESAFETALSRVQAIIAQDLPVLSLYFRGGSLVSYLDMSGLGRLSELDTYNGLEYWVGVAG